MFYHNVIVLNPLSANPIKWSNTLKRIVLRGWRLKDLYSLN